MPDRAIAAEQGRRARSSSQCGSGWASHYADVPDEVGFHFADERFVPDEYVSINEVGKMHTYRVVSVSHL
jgi:hypothetical protein